MRRLFIVLVLALLFGASNVLAQAKLGVWRDANDYWGSTDKLGHGLFYGWVSKEFADITKSKWAGAGISLGIGALNEVKDAYVPWESQGMIGGDGWSWWDLSADIVGIGWSWWFPRSHTQAESGSCSRPLSELWPKVETAFAIGLGWTGASLVYNFIDKGRAFPNGSGKWQDITGKGAGFQHVMSDFNGEVSFIGPWWLNSNLRPYLPLGWRTLTITTTLVGWEVVNGYIRDRDVPFWGAEGFRGGDISVGMTSTMLVVVYDVFFYPKSAVCQPQVSYQIVPARQGLGLQFNW